MFEEEVFEITDFTTSSDWERFISNLEEIIHQWELPSKQIETKLKKGAFVNGTWKERHETLKFSRAKLILSYHYLEEQDDNKILRRFEDLNQTQDEQSAVKPPIACQDFMSRDNDFPGRAHCLVRWYGMRHFIILSSDANTEAINSEDKTKMLISSACIALHNTRCFVPFFVQVNQMKRRFYQGVCQGDGIRTYFDMIHFKEVPGPLRYLSELLNLFKQKLQSPIECTPVMVSIRFTHSLKVWPQGWELDFNEENNSNEENDSNEDYSEKNIEYKDEKKQELFCNKLPWGCSKEPVYELLLSTFWPNLSEEIVVDSPVHSDLEPLQAPNWSLRVIFKDRNTFYLSDSIGQFLDLKKTKQSKEQILGKLFADIQADEAGIEIKQAFNKLTNPLYIPIPQFQFLSNWDRSQWIKEKCLSNIFSSKTDESHDQSEINHKEFKSLKSAPLGSLTWLIAMTICNVYNTYKELADIAFLWKEIIVQLRNRWEDVQLLPRIEPGTPDLGSCLLHQKLQMLNCCIEQKIKREKLVNELLDKKSKQEDSDDEFFDCNEDEPMDSSTSGPQQPEGRLSKCGDLKLLNIDEDMYIPITQEPPPMTEDLLQEQSRILSQLGTSSESAALRARMQCASLISDMEAFKAANPGCVIEDFIRWHSPRDWIESDDCTSKDGTKGQLSQRMQIPGNTWFEVWESAKPVPVHRQKRLFDYTKEAEKVFHYLNSLTINDLVELLMPIIIQSAVIQIDEKRNELQVQNEIEFYKDAIIIHCNSLSFDLSLNLIRDNEIKMLNLESLVKKFSIAHDLEFGEHTPKEQNEIRNFVINLLKQPEVDIIKAGFGYFGKLIRRMFIESQITVYESNLSIGERGEADTKSITKLPFPIAKEFIFRLSLPRPKSYSRSVPHRMYCLISPGEFRLAGAFSEDTSYF